MFPGPRGLGEGQEGGASARKPPCRSRQAARAFWATAEASAGSAGASSACKPLHAPAKGATPAVARLRPRAGGFNPRPREGGDCRTLSPCRLAHSFNPRPREGGDDLVREDLAKLEIVSIHAPAKGATTARPVSVRFAKVSIHAPAKEATIRPIRVQQRRQRFDPRLREGGDPARRGCWSFRRPFRSTPPRRGRRGGNGLLQVPGAFRSTPPRRGRPSYLTMRYIR